ncbi:TOMM precursor leader peptide-binding protein [Plantactinospora mayteni]|uniref:TOMM precursor leader peptide-binding protein n=1 Tax=Plantactinospora mayteni TaxID=566021 RepID=UPI001EF6065F|nr:TOMM precursor leader peptide-binding protein [Plantactinospora mayteni]
MLREALRASGGPGPDVEVHELGFRDELTVEVEEGPAEGGRPVPVFLYGHHAVIGPVPGTTPDRPGCARCLARRWQSVRPATLRDALELGGGTRPVGASPYLTRFAADLLAAVIRAETGHARPGAEPGGVQSGAEPSSVRPDSESGGGTAGPAVHHVDLVTFRVRRWPLAPDPECPRCGRRVPDSREQATPALGPAPKRSPDSFRLRPVEAYPLDLDAFVNPVCGALSASAIHDLSSTSTAAVIGAFTLRSGQYLRETLYGGHADSYAASARVAVLEGLERAAGLRARGKAASVVASLDDLGDAALDPRTCGVYADDFYQRNPYLVRFTPDTEVSWVWGYSLRDERPILVPEVLAYYHTPPVESRFVQETSNGCASGGSLAEAVYFGLMEVVERDAFLLAWYGRAALPEIDPTTSTRPGTRQMVDRLAMYGYQARFFDTRISFTIPIVTGVAVRRDGGLGTLCFGGGASLDPEAALAAALCEIATDAVKVRLRAGADEARLRPMLDDYDLVRGLHDHPLLYGLPPMARHAAFLLDPRPDGPAPLRERFATVSPPAADLLDDLRRCVDEIGAAGFDVIVVDQTMPEERDLGLHTVKVIVPGLVPIDFGWQRQRAPLLPRTRTALRAAGLRDRDLRPEELNNAPHPFP